MELTKAEILANETIEHYRLASQKRGVCLPEYTLIKLAIKHSEITKSSVKRKDKNRVEKIEFCELVIKALKDKLELHN